MKGKGVGRGFGSGVNGWFGVYTGFIEMGVGCEDFKRLHFRYFVGFGEKKRIFLL